MLSPKKTKFKKYRKGRIGRVETRDIQLHFGEYGLAAEKSVRLTARQIEATRRAIIKKIKKIGKLWVRIFPDIPVTKKPSEVRMGKGKGSVEFWTCKVKKQKILFEIGGISSDLAKEAFKIGSSKLPIPTKFLQKNDTSAY